MDVTYRVDAQMHKAIQGFLAVAQAQGKATDGFKNFSKAGKQADSVMGDMVRGMKGFLTGLVGIGTATAAFKGFFDTLAKHQETVATFEKSFTKFAGQGNNINRLAELKTNVLDLSGAWGLNAAEVIAAKEEIQNGLEQLGGGAMKTAEQGTIRLNKVMGVGLPEAAKFSVKAMQGWNKELGTNEQAIDRMVELCDDLGDEATQMLSAITTDAKRAGLSWSEMAATVRLFREEGGKTKETNSALKATFNGLSDAMEKGVIPATATFMDKIREVQKLSKSDPQRFKEFFGGARSELELLFPVLDRLEQKMKEIEGMTGGKTQAKMGKRLEDTAYFTTSVGASVEAMIKNQPVEDTQWLTQWGPLMTRQKLLTLGLNRRGGPMTHWMTEMGAPGRWAATIADMALMRGAGRKDPNPLMEGLHYAQQKLRDAGRNTEADMLELQIGKTVAGLPGRESWMTGPEDAKQYAIKMQESLGTLTMPDFMKWRRWERAKTQPYMGTELRPENPASPQLSVRAETAKRAAEAEQAMMKPGWDLVVKAINEAAQNLVAGSRLKVDPLNPSHIDH